MWLDFLSTFLLQVHNRGESYHSLRKHIAYVHQEKFRVHSVQEQQIWRMQLTGS